MRLKIRLRKSNSSQRRGEKIYMLGKIMA